MNTTSTFRGTKIISRERKKILCRIDRFIYEKLYINNKNERNITYPGFVKLEYSLAVIAEELLFLILLVDPTGCFRPIYIS